MIFHFQYLDTGVMLRRLFLLPVIGLAFFVFYIFLLAKSPPLYYLDTQLNLVSISLLYEFKSRSQYIL